MKMPVTRYGLREILSGSLLCVLLAFIFSRVYFPLVLLPLGLWIFLISFFRDPERAGHAGPDEFVSPADGTIADIETISAPAFLDGKALRIGIFMSLFNVHVNRSPCRGSVRFTEHHPGEYHDARHEKSKTDNEHNFIGLQRDDGRKVLVNQIAGMVARRIVCTVESGDTLESGERVGMIKFGSRVELYIPLTNSPIAMVKVGEKVKGGRDILARYGEPENGTARSQQNGPPAQDEMQ